MKPQAKSALSLALPIVGGIAAGMRCDASEWVENSSQTNPRVAAYTVKTYTEGPFDEYKAAADQIAAVAEKAVAELRDKLDSEYKAAAAASFPDEDIFMAIADDIGFDATGKPTKVNELDEIGAELAKFISKERGDE